MLAKWFPTDTELKKRLDGRFPAQPARNTAEAKKIIEAAAKAPWEPDDINQRENDLRRALSYFESNVDNATAYLRAVVDLQVTKASALRTYCALVVAVAAFLSQQKATEDYQYFLLLGTIFCCLIAALLTISTSWTSWPTSENFSSGTKESEWLVSLLRGRGMRVNISVILTLVATVTLMVVFIPTGYGRVNRNINRDSPVDDTETKPLPSTPSDTIAPRPNTEKLPPEMPNSKVENNVGKRGAGGLTMNATHLIELNSPSSPSLVKSN